MHIKTRLAIDDTSGNSAEKTGKMHDEIKITFLPDNSPVSILSRLNDCANCFPKDFIDFVLLV